MVKRKYTSPVLRMGLKPEDEDPTIVFGGSQGTSGNDSMWTFDGIGEDDLAMIELNCDDLDLQTMDTDGNGVITNAEFQAWYEENGTW